MASFRKCRGWANKNKKLAPLTSMFLSHGSQEVHCMWHKENTAVAHLGGCLCLQRLVWASASSLGKVSDSVLFSSSCKAPNDVSKRACALRVGSRRSTPKPGNTLHVHPLMMGVAGLQELDLRPLLSPKVISVVAKIPLYHSVLMLCHEDIELLPMNMLASSEDMVASFASFF